MRDITSELEYLMGYKPSEQTVAEAEEWLTTYPDGNLAEWVEAMIEIGAM